MYSVLCEAYASLSLLKLIYLDMCTALLLTLVSSAGGPGFNPQSYQRRYKNGTSSSLV